MTETFSPSPIDWHQPFVDFWKGAREVLHPRRADVVDESVLSKDIAERRKQIYQLLRQKGVDPYPGWVDPHEFPEVIEDSVREFCDQINASDWARTVNVSNSPPDLEVPLPSPDANFLLDMQDPRSLRFIQALMDRMAEFKDAFSDVHVSYSTHAEHALSMRLASGKEDPESFRIDFEQKLKRDAAAQTPQDLGIHLFQDRLQFFGVSFRFQPSQHWYQMMSNKMGARKYALARLHPEQLVSMYGTSESLPFLKSLLKQGEDEILIYSNPKLLVNRQAERFFQLLSQYAKIPAVQQLCQQFFEEIQILFQAIDEISHESL